MKNKNKAVMVFSGLALMTNASAHIPTQKIVPSKSFVEETYMIKTPVGLKICGRKSEERKAILNKIRSIKEQIRLTHQEMKAVDKVCDNCFQGITERTERKLSRLQLQEAQKNRVPISTVMVDIVARYKGIVIIDQFEI